MSDPIDPRDVLTSLVTAALMAAEADAAAPDSGLIFRPEWRPTPRTRGSTSQPQRTPGVNKSSSWLSFITNQLSRSGIQLQQYEPFRPPEKPTPSSAPEPPLVSTSPPPAPSVPALLLPPGRLPPPQLQLQEDAVSELLKKNQDVFDEVINHPFPRALGKGTASLDGFRYYMIQDMLYLETCARLKMNAVAASPNFEDIETFEFRHKSSIEYVKKLKEICITMLGIPESTIKTTSRSVELDASERFYKDSLRNEDALLGYYVVLLPCVLTYWRIAECLMNDPSTVKNVVYHSAWTVVNYDPSSVGKYTKFINENIAAKGGIDRWNYIFRIACQLEAKLFNTGLQSSIPFQIIPDGTYSIHISSGKSVVLAIPDVGGLSQPPFDKLLAGYFPRDAGSPVLGVNKTGGDNERWHVVATKAGYTFQNLGTSLYLGISTESDREEGRILQAVFEPYYWWINPVSSQPDQASLVYQIYDSVNLRYTLHAGIEVLNSIGSTNYSYTPIIAHENSEISCQMWSFNDKFDQLENAQVYTRVPGSIPICNDQKSAACGSLKEQNSSNILIGIIGQTKSGKSSFIARLTGNESIKIGHGVESETSDIGHYNYFDKGGRCVTFVDSPGFDHSGQGLTDTDVLRKIAAFLEEEFNRKLSGIIYLHRITDTRMGGVSARNLRMFRKLCSDDVLKNVVVVTTRWDDVQEKDRQAMIKREKELMETPGECFEPLIAAGGRFLRHDNTAGSAHRIMEAFLENDPIPLQIQLEMHDGVTLEDTAAGSELAAELKKLMDKHSSEMKNLKEEMEEAIAAKDEALKKELDAERIKMQKEMTKWEEQKKALAEGLAASREEARKKQEEADHKLREQGVEFERRVKESEEKAENERKKYTTERAAADKWFKETENSWRADALQRQEEADRRLREKGAEFERWVKMSEEKYTAERAAADKWFKETENSWRADALQRQEEADRRLREQGAEFERWVKTNNR